LQLSTRFATGKIVPHNRWTKPSRRLIGEVFDEKGQAVLVEGFPSENKHPHITISCIEGVPPKYSNELVTRIPVQAFPIKELSGKVVFVAQ
jgi:hypothetical protein